jgi:AcrR family transcriptional regulator
MEIEYNRGMTKPKGTVKPKRVRRDRTEEILETATHLFGEHGFQGATLSLIAESVGLTEAGVLHYFPSKVHLLQGVLAYHEQKDIDKYLEMLESEKKNTSEIFRLLEDLNAQNEKIPGLIQLFTVLVGESVRSEHPSHEYFVDRYRRGRKMYVNQFFKLIKTEIRPEVDLDELASLIMAVMDGLQIQWLLDPKKVNMTATFKLFSKIVVGYLEE